MDNLIKYIKKCKNNNNMRFVIYLFIALVISSYLTMAILQSLLSSLLVTIILLFICFGKGVQSLLAFLISGKEITRQEDLINIAGPINQTISTMKEAGLDLSDDIRFFVAKSEIPFAYAIGNNTIVVSEALSALGKESPDIFQAKILNELYRMHTGDSNNILAILGSNLLVSLVAIIVLGINYFNMKTGRRYAGLFGNRNEVQDATFIFIIVSIIVVIWAAISYLFIKADVKRNILESDKFVSKLGYGQYMCYYLDNYTPATTPYKLKIFEMGNPSVDQRIGAMQNMGVAYAKNY